jgi:SAM-dependent methyltransferase
MAYEDHFSPQSALYRRHRPHYPAELFAFLASLVPEHELAWDVGTGSGQAAVGLTRYFDHVLATDASAAQIENALYNERIEYRVCAAESIDLDSRSVDLVTAAQSLHWFDLGPFFEQVHRVLKPGGVFAAWCYMLTRVTPEIDKILDGYYLETVGPFWSPRIRYVDEHYATIPFPFEPVATPMIELKSIWSLDEMEGYLESWSATQEFMGVKGYDPVQEMHPQLARAWGAPERERLVRWPLYFRIGSVRDAVKPGPAERYLAHSR